MRAHVICKAATFEGPDTIAMHMARSRVLGVPRSGGIVTPRGSSERHAAG